MAASMIPKAWFRAAPQQAVAEAVAAPTLIVLTEHLRGQAHQLTDAVYRLGRGGAVDIPLADTTVSTVHCELRREADGGYSVHDIGSTNGTRINGRRLTQPERLANSDILQIGSVELMYDSHDGSVDSSQDRKKDLDLDHTAGGETIRPLGNVSPFVHEPSAELSPGMKRLLLAVVLVLIIAAGALGWQLLVYLME